MSRARAIAKVLVQHAAFTLPAQRRHWARAMLAEVDHLPHGLASLHWGLGCVLAAYRERICAMNRSMHDIPRWLLGLEALVCLGPVTLLWSIAVYLALTTANGESLRMAIIAGTLAPLALLAALWALADAGASLGKLLGALCVAFAALAALQLAYPDATWFAFDWRVWLLNSVLPSAVCAHLALLSFRARRPAAVAGQ